MQLKDLKAGDIVVNASRLVIYLSALTLNKFKGYFICSCTEDDLKYNRDFFIEYAQKVLTDIIEKPAQENRIITTVCAQDKELLCIKELSLNPDAFKSWYLKSKFVCDLPDLYDMKDFREKKFGEQDWVTALNVNTGEVYTTKSKKKFLLCVKPNLFIVLLENDLEFLRDKKYQELLSSLKYRRKEAVGKEVCDWYYYPGRTKLYSCNVYVDIEILLDIAHSMYII